MIHHFNNTKIGIENDIKLQIDNHYKSIRLGIEKRACQVKKNFIFQPSKILIEKEIKNAKINIIKNYQCVNNKITSNIEEIMDDVSGFYENLMGSDSVEKIVLDNYDFKIKPILDKDKNLFLDYDFEVKEFLECIMGMKDAAPGPNGLTLGFYKKYFKFFGPFFVNLLNNKESFYSLTFKQSIIKLIPKNNNKVKTVKDLRPISLTNYEYRFLTKVIANRIFKIGNLLIKDHQTCGVIGRRISDNIFLVRDLIDDANIRKKPLKLIGIDQRKAFDSISHNYLFKLIEHLNIGFFLTSCIKNLYTNSFTNIWTNNFISEKIFIKSGIKQGCPLSNMLYILAIEELLINIENNNNIKGYIVNNGLKNIEIKATVYADDVTGYVINESSIKEFFIEFDKWGEISGASINKEKTELIDIQNKNVYKEMKILGVYFDNNGFSKNNFKLLLSKISKTIDIWNTIRLNMLERIVIVKTFILSKVWFLANFSFIDKDMVKTLKL